MTSKRLTPEDVHSIGVAAFMNALGLMADAEILLAAGRPRRAYALGVIAVEEAAKHLVCRDVLQRWTGTVTVAELNSLLRSPGNAHLSRYTDLLAYLRGAWLHSSTPPPNLDEIAAMARADMRARERVLYVEVASDGAPMTPEGVTETESRDWVSGMRDLFLTLGIAWRRGLDDALAEAQGSQEV